MTVKGHYNGSVVVLDEPAPVDHEVDVEITFPGSDEAQSGIARRFHWASREELAHPSAISFADEVIRQRRQE